METTASDYVGDDDAVKKQDGTLTLRFIEKINGDLAGRKTMNCKQPTEKQLGASASELVKNTISSSEKSAFPVCRVKMKVWPTVVASCDEFEKLHEMVECNRV